MYGICIGRLALEAYRVPMSMDDDTSTSCGPWSQTMWAFIDRSWWVCWLHSSNVECWWYQRQITASWGDRFLNRTMCIFCNWFLPLRCCWYFVLVGESSPVKERCRCCNIPLNKKWSSLGCASWYEHLRKSDPARAHWASCSDLLANGSFFFDGAWWYYLPCCTDLAKVEVCCFGYGFG